MKLRVAALLLTIILLLAACGPARPETVDTGLPSQTVQSQTDASRTDTPEETASTGIPDTKPPVDTEVPSTEAPPETDPPLSPGGFKVYTDPSHYSPYKPPEAKYTKPDGADYSEFHPQAGLGLVYPYVSNKLYTSHELGYSYEGGYRYGFVDRSGRILTDGIYIGVDTLVNYRYDDGETREQAPLWLVERVDNVVLHHESTEYGDYTYPEGEMTYGVVAMDGSFALPCEFRSIQLMDGGDRMLCIRSWDGTPDFSIYDLHGKLLLTAEDLFAGHMDCDGWGVEFSEGLYCVEAVYYKNDGSYDDRNNLCWYADEQGKLVLGPYRSGNAFHEGLACVSEDGDLYGYIEKNGRWVIRPRYSWTADFTNGRAQQCVGENRRVVIDKTGGELISRWNSYISRCPCGFQMDDPNDSSKTVFYDRDGNILFSEAGDWTCLAEDLFARTLDNDLVLHSLKPGAEDLRVEGVTYLYHGVALINGELLHGYRGENYETGRKVFVPEDLSRVYEVTESNPLNIMGYEQSYQTYDQMSGERFWIIRIGTEWAIYDNEGQFRGKFKVQYPSLIGGRLYEVGEFACTYRDLDGNLLFSYPLVSED